jgi:ABC-type glycerol-3-phosphate transport system substrate-binding protein
MYAKYNIKVPTTWTEFIKVMDAFKAAKTPGIILELQFAETIGQKMNSMYKMALGNAGADKFFNDLAYGRTTFAQNPAAQEAVASSWLTDYTCSQGAGTSTNEMVSDFAAGRREPVRRARGTSRHQGKGGP